MTALSPHMEIDAQPICFSKLLISAIEHPSVMAGGRFAPEAVEILPVDENGRLRLEELEEKLANLDVPVLVSLMAANNETGVLQPVAEVGDIVHAKRGLLHVDAVQLAGRADIKANTQGADILTLSAHKIGGPRGAGALVRIRPGLRIGPLITGGGQEGRARAGTENVGAIVGFGAAAATIDTDLEKAKTVCKLRDWLEHELVPISPDVIVFGRDGERLCNTSCFAVPGMEAETTVIGLDLEGIAVSSGSACSSGRVAASHVLQAMGVSADIAKCAIRVSLGPETTKKDIEEFLSVWHSLCHRFARGADHSTSLIRRLRQPADLEPAMDGQNDASSARNDRSSQIDRHRQVQVRVCHRHSVRKSA